MYLSVLVIRIVNEILEVVYIQNLVTIDANKLHR
jgi:hypothetical protein